jgi:hypothetical protein
MTKHINTSSFRFLKRRPASQGICDNSKAQALTKHALKPAQRLRLETEARTGEFKIEEAKAKSEEDLQQLLGRPQLFPNSPTRRGTFNEVVTAACS